MKRGNADYKKTGTLFGRILLITTLGITLFNNLLVVWISEVKMFQGIQMTLIIGVTPIAVLPFLILWSRYLDRSGKLIHSMMAVGVAVAVLTILMVFTDNFVVFFLLNFLRNIATCPLAGMQDQYLTNIVENGNLEFGKIRVCGTLGFGIAGLVAAIIIKWFGLTACMTVSSLLVLTPAFAMKALPEVTQAEEEEHRETSFKKSITALMKNKQFVSLLILTCTAVGVSEGASMYGIQRVLMGLCCPTEYIGFIPFILVAGEVVFLRISDKIHMDELSVYASSIVIGVVRWIVLAYSGSYSLIMATCLGHGIVVGIFIPIQNRKIVKIVKPEFQATAYILMSASRIIVPALLNLICESMIKTTGISVVGKVYMTAMIPGIVCISYLVMKKNSLKIWKKGYN